MQSNFTFNLFIIWQIIFLFQKPKSEISIELNRNILKTAYYLYSASPNPFQILAKILFQYPKIDFFIKCFNELGTD
jgi:hypothetical protein